MARKRTPRQLECTAHHEAGHAVASVILQRAFEYVTIVPDEEHGSLGQLLNREFPASFDPDRVDDKTARWLEREITICYAGPIAEETYTGRKNAVGAREDRDQADRWGVYRHSEWRLRGKYLDYMLERTRASVKSPLWWCQIEALAKALLETPKIGHSKVRAIVRSAVEDARVQFVERIRQARLAECKAAGQNAKS